MAPVVVGAEKVEDVLLSSLALVLDLLSLVFVLLSLLFPPRWNMPPSALRAFPRISLPELLLLLLLLLLPFLSAAVGIIVGLKKDDVVAAVKSTFDCTSF